MPPEADAPRALDAHEAAPLLAIAQAHLGALQGPEAPEGAWGSWAAEAPLLHLGEALPKATLSAPAFALAQSTLRRLWAEAHGEAPCAPHFPPDALRLHGAWAEGEDRAQAWALAPEATQGGRWALGFGFVREAEAWKLAWTLLEAEAPAAPRPWSWGPGHQAALAFLLEGFGPLPPRGWLDLAWRRLGGLPEVRFHALPEARFSCQGSTRCCTPGFVNLLPTRAQAFLDALPWGEGLEAPAQGHQLPLDAPTGLLLLKDQHERCRFLDGADRCQLHAHLGWQPFPLCANYPIEFVAHPDGVDVSALQSCPSARQGMGLPLLAPQRLADLSERLALAALPQAPEALHLSPDAPADWPAFRAAEQAVLAALAAPFGVAERLWRAHLVLLAHEAASQAPCEAERAAALASLPPDHHPTTAWPGRPIAPMDRQGAGLAWLWRTMPGLTEGLTAPTALLDAPGPAAQSLGARMRYLTHRKRPYALDQGLRTQLGAAAVLGLQGLALMAAHPDGQLPDALWTQLLRRFTGAYVFQLMDADPQGAEALLTRAGHADFLPQLVALPEALPLR